MLLYHNIIDIIVNTLNNYIKKKNTYTVQKGDSLYQIAKKYNEGELQAENIIEDKEYKMYDCEKLVPKSEITKKEEDYYTMTKKTYKGAKVWNVSNQLGIHTTYENQEDAFTLCEEINKEVLGYIK